jgi:hypothetical protein
MVGIVAELGPCFNFRMMYEDFIFTAEPNHIKVYRLVRRSRHGVITDTVTRRPS